MIFVDSNVPMYVAGGAHPLREPALRFMERVRAGELEACTSAEVLQEILHRYAGLGRRDLAGRVYALFVQLCPIVLPVTLALIVLLPVHAIARMDRWGSRRVS